MLIKDVINIPWIKRIEGKEKARILLYLGPGFGQGHIDCILAKWKDHERQLYLFDVGLIGRSFENNSVHSLYVIYYAGLSFALFEATSSDEYIVKRYTTIYDLQIFDLAIGVLVFLLMESVQNGGVVQLENEFLLMNRKNSKLIPGKMGTKDV